MSVNVSDGSLNFVASIDDTDLNARLKTIETNILATGTAATKASDQQIKSIMQLKIQLQSYQAIAEKATDPARLLEYNKKIEDLKTKITQMTNAGKTGFDEMGNAIKEVEVETEVATQKVDKFQAAINRATDISAIGARVVSQFSRQIIGLGVGMLSVTIGAKALEALATWVSNLDIFTGRLNQAVQNLKALNEVQKDASEKAGESIGKFTILSDTVKDLSISYKDRLAAANELKKLWPLELANSSAQAIANGTEKDSLDKLADSVVKLAKAKAAATEIEKIEGDIIALQIERDKNNNAKADEIDKGRIQTKKQFTDALIYEAQTYGKTIPTQKEIADAYNKYQLQQTTAVEQGIKKRTDAANKDIADQIKVKQNTVKYLEQYGGLDNEAKTIEPDKPPAKDPSIGVGEALLAAQTSLLEKIDALKEKYASKDKTRDEQAIDAIKANFRDVNNAIDAQNTRLANSLKDKKITAAQAATLGIVPQQRLTDADLNNAIAGELGTQSVEKLKLQVEQQKAIFSEYEAFKLKAGTDAANQLYGNQLKGFNSYIDYLKSLQPTENELTSTNPTIKATASKTQDYLRPLLAAASTAKIVANQKELETLIQQNQSYQERREELIQKANDQIKVLTEAGFVDQTGIVAAQLQAQLEIEDNGQAQKIENAKKLTSTILNETKEQATLQINAAKAQNDLELASGKISIQTYEAVAEQVNKAQGSLKNNQTLNILDQIGTAFATIGADISKTNSNFGALISSLGTVLTQTKSLSDAAARIKTNGGFINSLFGSGDGNGGTDPKDAISAISTGIQGIVSLIENVTSAAAARKQADQDYYNSVLAYQAQYNELLIQQQQLQYQIDGNIFSPNYEGQLGDGAKALTQANAGEQQALQGLSAGQAIVAKKDVISGTNVAKGVASGAAAGAVIGSVLPGVGTIVGAVGGAVVGAITGLFATKAANVVTPLLQQYPSLIKVVDGVQQLNTAQAQALLQNNQVTDSTKVLIQTALDYQKEQTAALKQIQDALTSMVGSLGNDLENSLVTAFETGENAANAFGTTVSNVIGNMVQQFLFQDVFGAQFKKLQDKLTADAGASPAQLIADIEAGVKSMQPLVKEFEDGLTAAQQAGSQVGLTLFPASTPGGSASTFGGSISQSVTENTADILAGSLSGIQLNTMKANGIMESQLLCLGQLFNLAQNHLSVSIQIEANTRRTANTLDDNLPDMSNALKKIAANTNGSLAIQLRAAGIMGY